MFFVKHPFEEMVVILQHRSMIRQSQQQTNNQSLMQATIVDPRLTTAEEHAEYVRQAQVLFKLNHTMPCSFR